MRLLGRKRHALLERIEDLEQRLHAEERLAWLTMEHAPMGLALVSLDGRFMRVNPALAEFLATTPKWLEQRLVSEVVDRDDALHSADLLSRTIDRQLPGYRLEMRFRRGDGTSAWGDVAVALVTAQDGRPLHCILEIVDVTQRKREEDELRRQATVDPVTGVANRATLEATIRAAQEEAAATGTTAVILFVDLDRFKPINDRYGHAAGDEVLRTVAQRLTAAVRPADVVSRVGGDEFVIVCGRLAGAAAAESLARRLRRDLTNPIAVSAGDIEIGASIGLCVIQRDEAPDEAIRRADLAMYEEKRAHALDLRDRAVTG